MIVPLGVGVKKDGTEESPGLWHEFRRALLWDHVGSPNFGFAPRVGTYDVASTLTGAKSYDISGPRAALVPAVNRAVYLPTRCDKSFSFSVQTFSKMSSLGSRI